MDRNRIKGAAKQIKGSLKDAAGKVTGSTQLRAEAKQTKLREKCKAPTAS